MRFMNEKYFLSFLYINSLISCSLLITYYYEIKI